MKKRIELLEKRKAKEKHFLQEDGSIVAVMYNDNVHFKKNGKYEEIDNTLVEENDYYYNRNNDYKVNFNKNNKDIIMRLEKEKKYIDFQVKGSNIVNLTKEKKKSGLTEIVLYKNIFDDIDFEYQILPTKVKETIILKNKEKIKEKITFIIKTNLNIILDMNNHIIAKNGDEIIFCLDAPFMFDSNNNYNNNIYYDLNKKGDNYELNLILDLEWLNSNEITYPIYIDPTITEYNEENSVYDTYIYPGDTGVDKNSKDILKAGVELVNGSYVTNRTLLKFDLPEIGTSSEIVDATLFLVGYPDFAGPATDKTVAIHRIIEDWNETTANWDIMNTKYDHDRIESIMHCNRSWYDVDEQNQIIVTPVFNYAYLTTLVKKWYAGTPNYGIMIKLIEENYTDDKYPAFFSKNNNSQDYNPKPTLEITYRNQNGIEDYLDYKMQELTDGKLLVNTFNGNLTYIQDIGHTINAPLPVDVSLIYNTNDVMLNNSTVYGKGYKLNYDQTLKKELIDEETWLKFYDEDGTTHYCYSESNSDIIKYYDEDNLGITIEEQETIYVMTNNNNDKFTFTKNGEVAYLTKIEDACNNTITIIRDTNNLITKIIDNNDSEINIYYEQNKISIVNPIFETELNYLNGNLISINTINGIYNISYNENNLINTITDITGIKYEYTYFDEKPYRVKKVVQYGLDNELGNYFTLHYGFNVTKIVDSLDRIETLVFNSFGNVISRNSLGHDEDINNAYSISGTYGENEYNKNNMLSNCVPVKYVKNYLKNTSFEQDISNFTASEGLNMSYSTDCSVSGNRSLKLTSTAENQFVMMNPTLPNEKYYTFSGYFKSDHDMVIELSYLDISGNTIKESCLVKASEEFTRHDLSIYFNAYEYMEMLLIEIIHKGVGTTYIDDIQLEEGEVANNYNILENSDFSDGIDDWTLEAYKFATEIAEDGSMEDIPLPIANYFEVLNFNNNKNTALKINMNPLNRTSFSKQFPIKGTKGDVYRISFWYKNEGIETDEMMIANNLHMYFVPADGSLPEYCLPSSISFPPNQDIWQYFSYEVGADYDYSGVKLEFNQGRDANNFYITNLSLYKDIGTNYFEYDENGNVSSIKDSSNRVSILKYDKNNQLISASTPKGKKFSFEYDNTISDRVLSAISSTGISNQIKYDAFGNPILTRVSKKGNSDISTGNYRIRSKGTDKYFKAEYSSVFLESDTCSNTVWYLEKIENDFKISYSVIPDYHINYSNNSIILSTINEDNLFNLEKNNNGSYYIKLKTQETEGKYLKANGASLEVASLIDNDPLFEFYFEQGEKGLFIENIATYSDDGRFVTSVTDSNFNTTFYDTNTTTGMVNSITNANNQTISYTYDDKMQISSVSKGNKTINYSYNNNLLTKVTQNNKIYNFIYDKFLNISTIKLGDDIVLVNNTFEENNGNLKTITYGNNNVISFNYDNFDRIAEVIKMDNSYKYKYDNNGNIAKIISNDYTTKYMYDIMRRIIKYKYNNFIVDYKYDSNDNIINKNYCMDDCLNSITNTFNDDDAITSTTIDNDTIIYQYDELGRMLTKNINNNYETNYNYITFGKRTSMLSESVKNGDDKYSYKYDKLENITHIYNNDVLIRQYEYDEFNEIIEEIDYENNQKISYTYDNYGNLLSVIYKNLDTDTVIKNNEYTYGNTNWVDQLTKYDEDIITYDLIGNPIAIGNNVTMTWNNGKYLNSYIDTENSLNVSYKYKLNGRRNSKIVNNIETKYFLEGDNIIYEKRDNVILYYLYDPTGIIGLKYNGNMYYYIKDLQNNIIGILDSNNNLIVKYSYDAWGNILAIKDNLNNDITDPANIGLINPFRYKSYYFDQETNLYYLNTRYYSPKLRRFINTDNVFIEDNTSLLGYNLYAYCNNNPVNYEDSNGNMIMKNMTTYNLYDYKYTIDKKSAGNVIEIYTQNNYYVATINNNAIAFSYNLNPAYTTDISYTLSSALYNAYQDIYSEKMEGRSVKGIAMELDLHYEAYQVVPHPRLEEANIGTSKNDGNYMVSEGLAATRIIQVNDKTTSKKETSKKKKTKKKTTKKAGAVNTIVNFLKKLIFFA